MVICWAALLKHAIMAQRVLRSTNAPPMRQRVEMKLIERLGGNDILQQLMSLLWRYPGVDESQALGDPIDVGIYGEH